MIAVIGGTGHLGLGLAMRWAAARLPVVIGSRSLERARGDDAGAKARVAALAEAVGARGIDVGALSQAHTLERLTALVVSVGRRVRRHELGVRITGF